MRTIIVSLFIAMALLLPGCNGDKNQKETATSIPHEHTEGDDHDHSTAEIRNDETETGSAHTDEIHFSKAQAKAVGLTLETVLPGTFRQVIKTSGQILSSQGDETTIASTANGIVSFANRSIAPGTTIRTGETVVSVSAQKLPEGDPVAKAKNTYEAALKAFQRAENLVKDQIISEKRF